MLDWIPDNLFKRSLSSLRKFPTIEDPLKVMKKYFYFIFFPEIFTFFSDFLAMYRNGSIRKLWLISKFMTSQTGQQIARIHIWPSISRSKGNQAMKFGQIIKYIMRNTFSLKIMQKSRQRD